MERNKISLHILLRFSINCSNIPFFAILLLSTLLLLLSSTFLLPLPSFNLLPLQNLPDLLTSKMDLLFHFKTIDQSLFNPLSRHHPLSQSLSLSFCLPATSLSFPSLAGLLCPFGAVFRDNDKAIRQKSRC